MKGGKENQRKRHLDIVLSTAPALCRRSGCRRLQHNERAILQAGHHRSLEQQENARSKLASALQGQAARRNGKLAVRTSGAQAEDTHPRRQDDQRRGTYICG